MNRDEEDHRCIYCQGSDNYKLYQHLYSILESAKNTASEEFIDELMEKMDDVWWSMSETEQDKFDSERHAGHHGGVDHVTIGEDNDLARRN